MKKKKKKGVTKCYVLKIIFGYCLFLFGYFYFLHVRCKNSPIFLKNICYIYFLT